MTKLGFKGFMSCPHCIFMLTCPESFIINPLSHSSCSTLLTPIPAFCLWSEITIHQLRANLTDTRGEALGGGVDE